MANIRAVFGIVIATVALVSLLAAPVVHAQATKELCEGAGGTWDTAKTTCSTSGNKLTVAGILKSAAQILSFLVGATAVIMMIIGGFRYVLSNGDASAAAGAKNTILYSVIGLIVAGMAYAIVSFVTKNIK